MKRPLAAAAACATLALGLGADAAQAPRPERASAERAFRRAVAVELRRLHRLNDRLRQAVAHRPSVQEAITLGAVLFGVDRDRMSAIMWRESRHRPWAKNPGSTAAGLGQFLDSTWAATPCGRAGLSVYSAYANAACMGWYVANHGWSAWSVR